MTKIRCDLCKHTIENIEFKENEHWKKVTCPECGAEMFVQKSVDNDINFGLNDLDDNIGGMPRYCYENPFKECPHYGMTFCMSPCPQCKGELTFRLEEDIQ